MTSATIPVTTCYGQIREVSALSWSCIPNSRGDIWYKVEGMHGPERFAVLNTPDREAAHERYEELQRLLVDAQERAVVDELQNF